MEFEELLKEFMPLLCMPIMMCALSGIFKVLMMWMKGEIGTSENDKEIEKIERRYEEKNYIDEDLKKYFDYKE